MRCPELTRSALHLKASWSSLPKMLHELLLLCTLAANLTTAQSHWEAGARGWCQEPGIGEADNPGPPTTSAAAARVAFDDDDNVRCAQTLVLALSEDHHLGLQTPERGWQAMS